MGTKTISIMDDVYKLLRARKKIEESFSDVIRRKFKSKENIMDFAGSLKNISEDEAEEIKRNILNLRKRSTKELIDSI